MRQLLISTLLAGAVVSGAAAQDIVRTNPFLGTWHCNGFGNQPAAILTIGNPMYDYKAVDANWQPNAEGANGGGIMTFGAGQALPFGGPLLEQFSATGSFSENDYILVWEGANGFSLTCLLQVQ